MKKNQKILAAVAAIIVVVLIVVGVMISTKNTNEETSSSTNVETSEVVTTEESTKVESSTEVLASIGTAPEDSQSTVDKSGAINFPGSETSESSTSESSTETSTSESTTDSSNTESSASKTESTTESTTSSTSKTETSASSTSESSTSESSTSVTSTSAEPTTSETTTPVDNSSSTPSTPAGEQITQGSTGTTSLGTTYPIVSEFNKLGLNPNYDDFFSSDGMATEFTEAMGQANKSLGEALGYRSNDTPIDATNDYLAYLDAHISRKPESGYYVFVYAANIVDTTDGGTSSRAAHQVMLGAITSTPVEVEAALFEATFGNNSYGLDENGASWTTVGDCKLIWAYGDESQQMYFIKPAN